MHRRPMVVPAVDRARVSTAERALDELADPWRAQEGYWSGDPSAMWVWQETGLLQLDPQQELLVLGTRDRPVACLYLTGHRSRLAFPVTRVLDRFAWAPAATRDEVEAALIAARTLAVVYLPYVPYGALPPRLMDGQTRPAGVCPVVAPSDWHTYSSGMPPTLRKALHRAEQRAARCGRRLRRSVLAAGETAERLDELAAVEARGHRRSGLLLSGKHAQFVRRVIRDLDAAGHVRTHVIEDRDGVGAYLIGFAARRRYLLYTTALAARCQPLALGLLVLHDAIKGAVEGGEAVDIGNGSTRFKLRWATGVLQLASFLQLPRADNALVRHSPPPAEVFA